MERDEVASFRMRCSELELELAQTKEELQNLREQNRFLSSKIGGDENSQLHSGLSADDRYLLQKQIVQLTDQKESAESEAARLRSSLQTLEVSLNREIQKVRDESERQILFLRSQVLESKEMNSVLHEKLATHSSLTENLRLSEMDSFVTENILITSDAVLHRLTAERPLSSYKAKYDVSAEISGRTLVLRGKKLNVHLLKAEILEALNEMYATMTDPTKYSSGTKARDAARNSEVDHLRRTIATYEATVASLHTALQNAQERTATALNDQRKMAHDAAMRAEEAKLEKRTCALQIESLNRRIDELRESLDEAKNTNDLALKSLEAEANVTAEFRKENALLKAAVQRAVDGKELAERAAYSAAEQSRATSFNYQEMVKAGQSFEAEKKRADLLEATVRALKEEVETLRRSSTTTSESNATERGRLAERLRVQQNEISALRSELKDTMATLEQCRNEHQQANELVSELRRRLNEGSAESVRGGERGRLEVLSEENTTLRRELQQAFDDLRAVATAMKESKEVRQKAVSEVEHLETDRSRLVEERQTLEVELVRERMNFKTKEAELLMSLSQAKEEADHQRKRAEMLHEEYQRRIQEVMDHEARPHDASRLPRPTVKSRPKT